jgi:hypothetical protein
MSLLGALNHALARLDESADVEAVIDLYQRTQVVKRKLREFDQELKAEMVRWIDANGEIEIGTRRFYVGPKRTVKVIDKEAAAESLLEALGGDLTEFVECLTSEPFKQGHVKKLVGPNRHNELFRTETVTELKEGKARPVRELAVVDTRYLK